MRWLEAGLGRGRVAFTTRLGGVSEAPFDALNLGVLTDDAVDAVGENRRRLAAALGLAPERIAFALQVHGADLISQDGPDGWPARSFGDGAGRDGIPPADGQVVTEQGWAGLVFVADCLPVALAGPGGVAMLHCGWRGLATGIVTAGAEAIGATHAAIGPGIGPCCYEVGGEVLSAFSGLGPGIAFDGPKSQTPPADGPKSPTGSDKSAHRRDGVDISARRYLDLAEVARRLLAEAGVEEVESAGLCTRCEEGLFFSHRRDRGVTGRQAGVAWLEDG